MTWGVLVPVGLSGVPGPCPADSRRAASLPPSQLRQPGSPPDRAEGPWGSQQNPVESPWPALGVDRRQHSLAERPQRGALWGFSASWGNAKGSDHKISVGCGDASHLRQPWVPPPNPQVSVWGSLVTHIRHSLCPVKGRGGEGHGATSAITTWATLLRPRHQEVGVPAGARRGAWSGLAACTWLSQRHQRCV